MKKIFYQPTKPFLINQGFGENKACVSLDGNNKVITCDGNNPPSGFKSVYGKKGHLGLDLRARRGKEVYCAREGVVSFIDTNPQTGLDVRVKHLIDGELYKTTYEHLLGYQPKVGDKLKTGQLIGWADNTGWSSADHLHFQIDVLVDGNWVPVDPLEYMATIYAKDILAIDNKVKYLIEQVAMLVDNFGDYLRSRITSHNN